MKRKIGPAGVAIIVATGFIVALATPSAAQNLFSPAAQYTVGTAPVSVVIGDFNGDGKQDLAVANSGKEVVGSLFGGSGSVSILLGNGDGTFQQAVNYTSVGPPGLEPGERSGALPPTWIVAGDFNRDGKLDLAVTNADGVSVLLGNGDGTLQPVVSYLAMVGFFPTLAIGDFNGDGKLDLLVVADSLGEVSLMLGNGNGTFQPAGGIPGVENCIGLLPQNGKICLQAPAIGDFNGDDKADLAVPSIAGNYVNVLLGNGDGTFAPAVSYPTTGTKPTSVTVADFNSDGKLDLAVADSSGDIDILLGRGDGTFDAAVSYTAGCCPSAVAAGDVNGDGIPDLVVAGSNQITVLLGNGDGTFGLPQSYATSGLPFASSIAIGDFNGDGRADFVVAGGIGVTGNSATTVNACC